MAETPISSPPGMKITEENKLKGSLFIEAFGSLIDGISKDAESETEKALDITFNAIGAAASMVMFAIDPLGSLIGAGIGWLIEHVSFLRDALNVVMGNPEEIQANVEATKAKAVELRTLAEDHRSGLATFDGWTGKSSENFQASMDQLGAELDTLANAVETKAKIVAITGMLVTVLRDIIRDLISQLLGSLIGGALIAAATSVITFGASVVAYIGFAVGKAVALGVNISARIARVVASMSRLTGKIGNLDEVTAKVSKGWERFDNAADVAEISYEGYKAADGVDDAVDKVRGGSGSGGGDGSTATASATPRNVAELQPMKVGVRAEGELLGQRTEAFQPMKVGVRAEGELLGQRTEALQPMKVARAAEAEPMKLARAAEAEPMKLARAAEAEPMKLARLTEAEPMKLARLTEAEPMKLARLTEAEPMKVARLTEAEPMAPRYVQAQPLTPQHVAQPLTPQHVEAPQPTMADERFEAAKAALLHAREVNAGTSVTDAGKDAYGVS
jgi:uncharacterized protein YukE